MSDLLKELKANQLAQGPEARRDFHQLLQKSYKETGMAKMDAVKVCGKRLLNTRELFLTVWNQHSCA